MSRRGGATGTSTGKYTRLVQEALRVDTDSPATASASAAPEEPTESRTLDVDTERASASSTTTRPDDDASVTTPPEQTRVMDAEQARADAEMLLDDDDDEEEEAMEDEEDDERDGEAHGASTTQLFSCDVCPHVLFASRDELLAHAQAQHQGIFPDYAALHKIASQLAPHWASLKVRKKDTIRLWGEKICYVATTRDAGQDKMQEAHRAREQLELVIRRWQPGAKVFMFGSAVSFAVWDGLADVDFAVVDVEALEAGTWPPPERNAVRTTTELLRRAGFSFANIEPISHARVPIIKHHASAPIRLAERPVTWRPSRHPRHPRGRKQQQEEKGEEGDERAAQTAAEAQSVLEAEHVVARSVRFLLNQPATPMDRILLEGSVRQAVECATVPSLSSSGAVAEGAVQQIWWNRTADVMSVTCDSTTSAMKAATAPLSMASAALRAKVQPLHEECRPELFNVDFDLSFRAFGIRNSLLLRRYLTSHPCARPGAIVLKDWSKTSGVNNSVNGYLTSYAINIMWIYFLVHRGVIPYVDPIMDVPATLRAQPGVEQDAYLRDGFPEYIPFIPPDVIDDQLQEKEKEKNNNTSNADGSGSVASDALSDLHAQTGELLLDFFYFYAFDFDWQQHVVSLNRKGLTTKKRLGWDREDVMASTSGNNNSNNNGGTGGGGRRGYATTRYAFCIEDPYEVNLNLGRHMGVTKFLKVKTELYRAFLSLLKDGVNESCVFAATDAADARRARTQPVTAPSASKDKRAPATETSAPPTPAVPDRLPLRVLYRLTATSLQTLASYTAKNQHKHEQQKQSQPHVPWSSDATAGGIPSRRLEDTLRRRHPSELALALKVWNWQQLVHRLGLKEMHGVVYPRREVGARRVATPVNTPAPIVPSGAGPAIPTTSDSLADYTTTATASSALPSAVAAQTTVDALRDLPARGFAEQLVLALTTPGGYLALTPDWVAWSTPWVTLKTRFAPEATEAVAATPAQASASAATTAGVLGSTRPHAMSAPALSAAPVQHRPLLRGAFKRVCRK